MKVLSYVIMIIAVMFIMFPANVASSYRDFNEYYKYGKEATQLALKIDKLKTKYYLEYKDLDDLLETCNIIVKYSKYTNFNKYEVATIVLKESRFNKNAYNKSDGGRGLGQITNIKEWHKETLFWMTDPFDKDQNIRGILIVLEDNLKCYKTKKEAIKRYNGTKWKSVQYQKAVYRIKDEIKRVKTIRI